jgi:hypothetical protein
MTVTVIDNQSLLDIAIQEDGSVLAAFDWAVANEISVTETLYPGQTLINPNSQFRDADVANYFKSKFQFIATAHEIEENVSQYGFPYEFPISL